jgi:flagellum-specific peptidoglycan hydrolase FlgJ/murein DD-endopeptidase MepM/ murein hydrolase activator NlpD
MSTAKISAKNGSIAAPYIKRASGLLKGATAEYIREYMPTSVSTIESMKDTIKPFSASISNAGSVIAKTKELTAQQNLRKINDWFFGMNSSFDNGSADSDLSFDIEVGNSSEIIMAQLSAEERSANQISKTVVETSHRMVEAQLSATANILTSMDKVGAAVVSGFDNINNTLNKLLEVTTKNTSALIATSVAASVGSNSNNPMLSSGKFNLNAYKKLISSNVQGSEFGMLTAILPILTGSMGREMLSSDNLSKMGFAALMNKTNPNLKKNMEALDKSINGILMNSLIRLGDKRDQNNLIGTLGRIFGMDTNQKRLSTGRTNLEFKAVPFDTVAKESLVSTIPGYLRQILVQLGGPDQIYDYRSRSFRSKGAIARDFKDAAATSNSFRYASGSVRNTVGRYGNNDANYSNLRDMIHDLIMEDMGGSSRDRNHVSAQLSSEATAKKYINSLLKNSGINRGNGRAIGQLAKGYSSLDAQGLYDLRQQSITSSMKRNANLQEYIDNANMFGVDLSYISNTRDDNKNEIIRRYTGKSSSSIINSKSGISTGGTDYTNSALYEIYRRLNTGINVFQVGSSNEKSNKYKWIGKLPAPSSHSTNSDSETDKSSKPLVSSLTGHTDHTNMLLEDGKSGKVGKWASASGKNLVNALFNGNAEDVRIAFGQMVGDISEVASKPIKDFLIGNESANKKGVFAKINDSFGNVTGYFKHKFMGTGYEYTDESGKMVKVANNEKGGIIGYLKDNVMDVFKGGKNKAGKWLNDVYKYFDFGKSEGNTSSKKRAIISASVGAMAGLGFLGGPLGLLTGAIAGTALDSSNFGNILKEKLFGKDEFDKDGKSKHKTGIIEKVVNNITDPLRYQIGKTFDTAGNVLKKNILGPLSDIGFAIKERASNAAGSAVGKFFSQIFKGAGWIAKQALNIPLALAGIPIAYQGNAARAGMQVGGAVAGTGMNFIADMISGKSGREKLRDRRKERADQIKADKDASGYYEGGVFGSYKSWKKKQDEARSNKSNLSDYMASDKTVVDASIKTEENTSAMAKDIGSLTYHATHHDPITNSSIYTSDKGVYEKITDIFDLLKRRFDGGSGLSSLSGADGVNSILSAASGIGTQSGLSMEDVEDISSIADESNRGKPNKRSILSRFKNLLKRNASSNNTDGVSEKSKGMLSNIAGSVGDFIKDVLPSWAVPLGGLMLSLLSPAIKSIVWGDGENEGIVPQLGAAILSYITGNTSNESGSTSLPKSIGGINSSLNEIATGPLLSNAKIGGINITGSTDPIGLFGTFNNSKRAISGFKTLKSSASAASKVVKESVPLAQRFGAKFAVKAAMTSGAKTVTQTTLKGTAAGIFKGVKGSIKFLSSLLSFALDSIIMLFQGNEVFGKDKYSASLVQQASLIIGGALNGTGSGFADGFQWADIIDIAGNALKWTAVGAAMGSVVPILGNGIGAVLGFILGLILGMWGGKTLAKQIGNLFENSGASRATNYVGRDLYAKGHGFGSDVSSFVKGIGSKALNYIKSAAGSIANYVSSMTGKAKDIFNLMKNCNTNSGVNGYLKLISDISNIVSNTGSGGGRSFDLFSTAYRGHGSMYYQGNYGSVLDMNQSGCGPIAASYIANSYGRNITPMQAAQFLNNSGFRDSSGGTSSLGIAAINKQLGIPMASSGVNINAIGNKLSRGEPVALLGKSNDPNSPYTKSGHFIIADGMDSSGNITVMDPLNPTKRKYDINSIMNGAQEATYADGGVGYGDESKLNKGNPLNKSFRITSPFGDNSPFRGGISHRGVDMVPQDGSKQAQVGAAYNGTIVAIKSNIPDSFTGINDNTRRNSTGNYVSYKTPQGITVTNMHLKANSIPSNLRIGSSIRPGDKIGDMGSTGMSTGPHLHYQFKDDKGNYINPTASITGGATMNNFNSSASPYIASSNDGGIFSQLSSILGNTASKVMSFFGLSDSSTSSSINTTGDANSSDIIFSKAKNLDTSYTDYPGRSMGIESYQLNFILKVAPSAQATMDSGVLASVRIAQAIIESNWGRSSLTTEGNNLFGMKAFAGWSGRRISKPTKEWSASSGNYQTNASFRAYGSWDESIADQANNYTKVSAYKSSGLLGEKDYRQACIKIQKSGYATDPAYANKLIQMVDRYQLTYFDHPVTKGATASSRYYSNRMTMQDMAALNMSSDNNPMGGGIPSYDNSGSSIFTSRKSNVPNAGYGNKSSSRKINRGYGAKFPNAIGGSFSDTYEYDQNIKSASGMGMGNINEKLELLLSAALNELKAINNNTGGSTSALQELVSASGNNGSGSQTKTATRRSSAPPLNNNSNISSVLSIVKPL